MATTRLDSILLGSSDPERLSQWYQSAFHAQTDSYGILDFGGFGLLIEHRNDVVDRNPEPGRHILNFSTDNARLVTGHLEELGVTWVAHLEEREHGLFATLADPDGNYIQILQMNEAYYAESSTKAD